MISKLFYPKSVAVVGASNNPKKVGYSLLKNLKESFDGKIYPINPKEKEIQGIEAFSKLSEIKENIDLAIIVVPAKIVPLVLEEAGEKKIPSAIIISAGFGESGEEGKKLEKEVKKIAEKYQISVLGPNCLGLLNSDNGLNAAFVIDGIKKGETAFISQSGALCTAIIDWALEKNFGFSKFISIGNKAVVDEADLLEYLNKDEKTKVILMYLETIKNGKKFIKQAINSEKPIVLLKAGKTEYGKKAAMSHTGSMIQNNDVYKAMYRKTGIIEAESIEQMFEIARLLTKYQKITKKTLGIITNAGGVGVIAADSAYSLKINLPELKKEEIKKKLPRASGNNPLDVIGDANAEEYKKAIELFGENKEIGVILVLLTPQSVTEIPETAEAIIEANHKYNKPIIASFLGGKRVKEARKLLKAKGIINFDFPEKAIQAISGILKLGKKSEIKEDKIEKIAISEPKSLDESFKLLKKIGIPVAPYITGSKEEIIADCQKIGFPSVLKYDANIAHKTELGIVKKVNSENELKEKIKEIESKVKEHNLKGKYMLQKKAEGKNLIIGAVKDSSFGTVVNVGLGGIYTEVLKDISLGIAPLDKKEAEEMLKSLKTYKILEGVRGEKPVDLEKIKEVIVKVSEIMEASDIKEMEINPLIVKEDKIFAVDALFKF